MSEQIQNIKQTPYKFIFILVMVLILASCQTFASTPIPQVEETDFAESTDAVMAATIEPAIELPSTFQTSQLNPLDVPHTYVDEACRYLRNKWNPGNAKPGTVVMVIMVDEIKNGTTVEPGTISVFAFRDLMKELKSQGFMAIDMREFLFFIERNIVIPSRSVLIIQDGTYDGGYFDRYYQEYWEKWKWPVVNGWQSNKDFEDNVILDNQELEIEGFVDHQAQGVNPETKLSDESAKSVIARELQTPWNNFANVYGKNPYAFIWPNGGFGLRPVEAARLLKYQLGFTSNLRGPVMYNWIPLGNEIDPERPDYIPEGPINDPLMTIPRYSANEALKYIDQVRIIGGEATMYAEQNKAVEHQYYEIVCSEEYGPMPTP